LSWWSPPELHRARARKITKTDFDHFVVSGHFLAGNSATLSMSVREQSSPWNSKGNPRVLARDGGAIEEEIKLPPAGFALAALYYDRGFRQICR
jgi:hypothetical protein